MQENLEHPTKKTKVYIPCWKTITDLISGDSKDNFSIKVFFEYLSLQASKGVSLQYRDEPIVACRTYPIEEKLCDILYEQFDKSADERIIRVLELIFSALTHIEYQSKLNPQESVIELALILNDEFNIDIIIISNDENIEKVRNNLKLKYPESYKDDCFEILNTREWLKIEVENKNSEVLEALTKIYSLESDKSNQY